MSNNNSTASERTRFAGRFNDALDNILFPKLGGGRQARLSELLGIPAQDVGKWLKGEAFPPTSALVKLSGLTKARSNWLLSGQGEPYKKGHSPRGTRKNAPATSNSKLTKEAFDLGVTWSQLAKPQREAIAKVIRELAATH